MEARVLGVRRPLQHERFSIEGILCEMVRLHARVVPLQQHFPISALAFARWQDVSPSEGKASVLLRKAGWPDHVSLEMPLRHLVPGSQVPHHTWPCPQCCSVRLPHSFTPSGRDLVFPPSGARQPLGLCRCKGSSGRWRSRDGSFCGGCSGGSAADGGARGGRTGQVAAAGGGRAEVTA